MTHLYDLIHRTNNVHYCSFRSAMMEQNPDQIRQTTLPELPIEKEEMLNQLREKHDLKMEMLKNDMENVFKKKVDERMQKIKDSEMKMDRIHLEVILLKKN